MIKNRARKRPPRSGTLWVSTPPARAQDGRVQHNHRVKLDRLCAAGKIPVAPGSVNRIDFIHDDWCGIFAGGFCDCDPDVRLNGRAVDAE
jgi:hypothetical protein